MVGKPFLKWAGGKSQLLVDIRDRYPAELGKSITRYCEPFVGGGAVLFDLLANYSIKEVLINDINDELINTYNQIKFNVKSLVEELYLMQEKFWPMDTHERKEFYYKKRDKFNGLLINKSDGANIEKAALFIFLNRTCFNGLFRVNKSGMFNVPIGSYKKPTICDSENLYRISKLLQNVKAVSGSYKNCLSFIDKDSFVYIDPPYRPLSETASFTSYSSAPFNDLEQIDLGQFVNTINGIGAKVIVSNSDPKNSNNNDDFFDNLYKQYKINRVSAKRIINSDAANRGNITELLISNY